MGPLGGSSLRGSPWGTPWLASGLVTRPGLLPGFHRPIAPPPLPQTSPKSDPKQAQTTPTTSQPPPNHPQTIPQCPNHPKITPKPSPRHFKTRLLATGQIRRLHSERSRMVAWFWVYSGITNLEMRGGRQRGYPLGWIVSMDPQGDPPGGSLGTFPLQICSYHCFYEA